MYYFVQRKLRNNPGSRTGVPGPTERDIFRPGGGDEGLKASERAGVPTKCFQL
jgi:hypothetical protein